jgi:alpha-beta hydrolase superfamily lysophospholipase
LSRQAPIVIVLEVVFLVIFWTWALAALLFLRNTVLPRLPLAQTPESFNLPAQTVQFRATDGVMLEGWLVPGTSHQPWIILCHGLGTNRADVLEVGAGLHRAGFNLLFFDFRGHGGSAGRTTSFGWWEQRDLEGALVFLGQQPEIPARPYGVYGISMGGSVALMVAGRDERIGAVAVESPYTNLEESIGHHLTLMYPWVPKVPFHWYVLATYRMRFGIWPRHVSAEQGGRALNGRPLLLIHGAEDPRMPLAGITTMFNHASQPKDLWVVEGSGHLGVYTLNPQAYLDRLTRFFHASLK